MIYDNIKKLADEKGVSIYRIEKDTGIANASIQKWGKTANQTPSALILKKVADYLEVKVDELIKEEVG